MREYTEQQFYCQQCGDPFRATRKAKYCGARCRSRAYRAAKKVAFPLALTQNAERGLSADYGYIRGVSTLADKMLDELYNRHGYEAAKLCLAAMVAIQDGIDIKTEADYQIEESERAACLAAVGED